MSADNQRIKRDYHSTDAAMLVGIAAITDNAKNHVAELAEEDTTITDTYLDGLRSRIDDAIKDILGADNAASLRTATTTVNTGTDTALDTLRSIKGFIERKYDDNPTRRDELLSNLGFTSLYKATSHRQQEAIGELISRAFKALTEQLREELKNKGLSNTKLDSIDSLAATYSNQNIAQEGQKITRKSLTDDDVKTLNTLYKEVMVVAKTGQHTFHADRAKKDGYVFEKVVPQSSRTAGAANNPPAPPSA